MSKKIILADQYPVTTLGASAALAAAPGNPYSIVGMANGAKALLQLLHVRTCDLLITDFTLPHTRFPESLTMIGDIRRDFSDLPIIVMTMGISVGTVRALLALGVLGLFDKRSCTSELVSGAHQVLRRRQFFCTTFNALLLQHSPRVLPSRLSPWEADIVTLLGQGHKYQHIAARLGRTDKTLRQHIHLIKDKLGLPCDDALQHYATGIKSAQALEFDSIQARRRQLRGMA